MQLFRYKSHVNKRRISQAIQPMNIESESKELLSNDDDTDHDNSDINADIFGQKHYSIRNRVQTDLLRRVDAEVEIAFLKDIDTIDRTFECSVLLFLSWEMNTNEINDYKNKIKNMSMEEMDEGYTPLWKPDLILSNAISGVELNDMEIRGKKYNIIIKNNKYIIQCAKKANGAFAFVNNYSGFPLDVQRIWVIFETSDCSFNINKDSLNMGSANIITDEFEIKKTLLYSEDKHSHKWGSLSYLVIESVIKRSTKYYLFQVVCPTFFLALIGFSSFAIGMEAIQDRLALLVTLLLSQVSSQYVVASHLPKLNTLTVIDMYVLGSFIFTIVIIIGTAFCKLIHPEDVDKMEEIDDYVLYICIGFFVIYHLNCFRLGYIAYNDALNEINDDVYAGNSEYGSFEMKSVDDLKGPSIIKRSDSSSIVRYIEFGWNPSKILVNKSENDVSNDVDARFFLWLYMHI